MSRQSIRLLCLLLAVFVLTICAACGSPAPAANPVEPEEKTLQLDLSEFTIMRSDNASKDVADLSVRLRKEIETVCGYLINIGTDWIKRGEEVPADTAELLVGNTNRRKDDTLGSWDWSIAREGNRIYILGGSPEALSEAVTYFTKNFLTEGGTTMKDGFAKRHDFADFAPASIMDCGAAGDGVADDSAALKKYLASGCTNLVFPKGTYNLAHKPIDLPANTVITGESAESTTLLNINITAPYGLELKNITCDTGTDREIKCPGSVPIKANIMFNVMPVGAQSVSYYSCIFRNCDYASVAKHYTSDSENRFTESNIQDCQFRDIGRVAILHVLDIGKGVYSGNIFDHIGSEKLLTGDVAAMKLGDTSNNSTCGLKDGVITGNTFSNLISGDDIENQKHVIGVNFIAVQGTTVLVDNNTFTNLLGYGEDRESVYMKVRYLTVTNNTIVNGGFGEGYICNKSTAFDDGFAVIANNKLTGDYGIGIRSWGAATIENNEISLTAGRLAISCFSTAAKNISNSLTIKNNTITFGTGKPVIGGVKPESYASNYIIQAENVGCPVIIENNTISCTKGDSKLDFAIRAGSVIRDVTIQNNKINCELAGGITVNANTTVEDANTKVKIDIKNNSVTCKGQPINIMFQHSKPITTNRSFSVTGNTLNPLKSVSYGVMVSCGSGNNDKLVYEGDTAKDLFTSNVVYANVPNIESSKPGVITH